VSCGAAMPCGASTGDSRTVQHARPALGVVLASVQPWLAAGVRCACGSAGSIGMLMMGLTAMCVAPYVV